MNKLLLAIFISILFIACKKEKESAPVSEQIIQDADVIVLNEGNFQWGNASIDLYNSANQSIEHEVFKKNNNNLPIGDVVQSMVQLGEKAYVVINNSNKIRIINLKSLKSEGSIENLNSPRYILPINQSKAYVSDIYQDQLYVVNLSTQSIRKTIPTKGWTEEMVLVGKHAFITQVDSSQILVYHTDNDSLLRKISTNTSPYYLEVDVNEDVWVSCAGDSSTPSALHKINASSLTIDQTIYASSSHDFIGEIELSPQKDILYFISATGIKRMSISNHSIPTQNWINANGRNLYGISVNPNNGEVYLCDAIDFQQHGIVYRYSESGILIDQFKVGIIPGDVYFKQ